MFCPKCKAEYQPGYTTCGDCMIDLVPELPSDDTEGLKYIEYAEILSTNSPSDLPF
jgi:hypothetical protein